MENSVKLERKSVANMATDGFEEIELTGPKDELERYGVDVQLVSDKHLIRSWKDHQWGSEFNVDRMLEGFQHTDYDALILPGGVINADRLRRNKNAINIIHKFDDEGKIIAAICHGPQLLIEADLVKNKTLTSHTALKKDMINAGAIYEDYGVVSDENYITAQGPADISAFLKKIIDMLKV